MSTKDTVKELKSMISTGNAHVPFEEAVKGIPPEKRNVIPEGLPYSIWQLVEHIRITQWDILEFSHDPSHKSPPWPEGYWPGHPGEISEGKWHRSIDDVLHTRNAFFELLDADEVDLNRPFPHGDGQTLLREALLIADHTSYHVGQIIVIRRLLDCL